jgi:hypothetical protein
MAAAVLATIGLYSVLYKENKFFRFFEHVYLGLAVGWAIVAIWTETLHDQWWLKITGTADDGVHDGMPGYWAWVLILPIGLMAYLVFSKKYNWMSRVPIGIILGLWAGQQAQAWMTQYGPQIYNSMRPILPNTNVFVRPDITGLPPDQLAKVANTTYGSQAIDNLIFLFTLLSVLSYFLFSFEPKIKAFAGFQTSGRWLLMIGFGAIFGSTVMMRFALLIDRMYFIFIEFLQGHVFNPIFHR